MSAGADFSTVLKIQHHNDSVKPQVSFFCSGIQTGWYAPDRTETTESADK